jgi:transposase
MTHDSFSPAGVYVGIDVSKEKLDLARSDQNDVLQYANDPAGITSIVVMMKKAQPVLIVIESTGGLERPLVGALLDEDLPAALVHPGRVRNMAKALNINAKSDKIDARVLYLFGQKAQPRISQKASKNREDLSDLVTCRRQLITTRVQQSNRLGSSFSAAARKSINAIITALDKQIEKLDQQIRRLIDADDDFRDLEKILLSVPGVGPALTAALLADLPELGHLDRQPVCAIVGVAPFANESGNFKGQRSIRGGRAHLRNVLYMNALTAIRCNPVIKAFAKRLEQKNKEQKVVIVAAMRKLLSLLNVMVRDGLLWQELNIVKKLATTT